LSLGCTSTPLNLAAADSNPKKLGEFYWAEQLLDVMMAGQSTTALGQAELLIGKQNILRYNPTMPAKRFSLDGAREIQRLEGLGSNEAREALPAVRKMFLDKKAQPFLPYRQLPKLLPDAIPWPGKFSVKLYTNRIIFRFG
jgi:uncharacterized protein